MNPRSHLRLVYEANPLAMLAEQVLGFFLCSSLCRQLGRYTEGFASSADFPALALPPQAGGIGSDGKQRILGIEPIGPHHRLPLFLGSPDDILELESYGDVQQEAKKYDV